MPRQRNNPVHPVDDAWRRRKERIKNAEATHAKASRNVLKGSSDHKINAASHKARLSAIDRVFLAELRQLCNIPGFEDR